MGQPVLFLPVWNMYHKKAKIHGVSLSQLIFNYDFQTIFLGGIISSRLLFVAGSTNRFRSPGQMAPAQARRSAQSIGHAATVEHLHVGAGSV